MLEKEVKRNDYKSHVTLCTLQYLRPTSELHDPNFHLQVFQDKVDEILPIKVPPECQMERRNYLESESFIIRMMLIGFCWWLGWGVGGGGLEREGRLLALLVSLLPHRFLSCLQIQINVHILSTYLS